MQLSKRGKEPVEQPLFRVSERSRRTPRPRRIPVGFFRNPRPPRRNRDESSRNPRPTRTVSPPMPPEITAEPSPRAQFPPLPFLPRNRQYCGRAERGIPLRYSRATSAAGYETHSRCGCPPLVSTARILEDRPAPPTTSRKTDMPNHPKTSPPGNRPSLAATEKHAPPASAENHDAPSLEKPDA